MRPCFQSQFTHAFLKLQPLSSVIMPRQRQALPDAANPIGANPMERIIRQQLRQDANVFASIFKDADLTHVQKIKQWINVVTYSSGKIVARQERMSEADLFVAMNKAYYLRVQVIFEDVRTNSSYWANHFDFDCTFAQMMTQTFGVGSARPGFFFDYGENENLDASQVESAKVLWTSPTLWKKYNDIKTEMQGHMLPVFLKLRIKAVGDTFEFYSGGSVAEVTWSFLGAMFQVHTLFKCIYILCTHQLQSQIHANALYAERVRKAIAARPRNAVVGGAAVFGGGGAPDAAAPAAPAEGPQAEDGEGVLANDADAVDAAAPAVPAVGASRAPPPPNVAPPEQWCDTHINWRHYLSFVFFLNGPMTYFHPSPGHREVCPFLKKVPRSGPQDGVRPVSRSDSRRVQRAEARGDERAEVAGQNGEVLQMLQASRCALAAALCSAAHSCFTGWPKPPLPPRQTRCCGFSCSSSRNVPPTKPGLQVTLTN
jgi:hypothetical protein